MQVFDIPPAALTVTEYQMMSRECGCGQVTTAPAPPGVTGGPVCCGPNVVAAATLLASTDVIGIERTADLMGALLKAPVSTGFVSRCLVRLDAALTAAGFEDALKDALRSAEVPGADETPAPLATAAASAQGCGNPHVYTVRTLRGWTAGGPDPIWHGAAGNRTKASITGSGILDGFAGILVRDDYGGYLSYDAGLAGVQQCPARLYRYPGDAYATDPASQVWTRQAGDAPRAASAAVRAARDARQASPGPDLLTELRHSYDHPCSATAASASTTPPPAATATIPSPPSATPSPETPGCRHTQHDSTSQAPLTGYVHTAGDACYCPEFSGCDQFTFEPKPGRAPEVIAKEAPCSFFTIAVGGQAQPTLPAPRNCSAWRTGCSGCAKPPKSERQTKRPRGAYAPIHTPGETTRQLVD